MALAQLWIGVTGVRELSIGLLLLLLVTTSSSAAPVASPDVEALLDFRNAISDPEGFLHDWDASIDCNDGWSYVTCDDDGYVVYLNLGGKDFSGELPASLGELTSLQGLELQNNNLYGSIPSTLGDLQSLELMYLGNNALTGKIPSTLDNLEWLLALSLENNKLTGSIPSSLGNLLYLEQLYLENNNLNGRIPSALGNLESLQYLDLSNNRLSGSIPSALSKMTSLMELALGNNSLTGRIPLALGSLAKLDYLDLSHNRLSGSVPASLGQLPNLSALYLDHNKLTGSIPSALGSLPSILGLYLNHNSLSGSIPSQLGNLATVKFISMDNNRLTGSIPATLGNLAKLQGLFLFANKLTGSMPSTLSNLRNLRSLDLSDNMLSGQVILPVSPYFRILNLKNTFVSGELKVPSNILANCTVDYAQGGLDLNLGGTCLRLSSQLLGECYEPYKTDAECRSFCNALQPQGACGSHGVCVWDAKSKARRCKCDEGYKNANTTTCVFAAPYSTGLDFVTPTGVTSSLNGRFHHASANYLNSRSPNPVWQVALEWNWAQQLRTWRVKDQRKCGACWAFAATGALEAAYAITYAVETPPVLSEQQIIDCVVPDSCSGGWPGAALNFAAKGPVQPSKSYPYKAVSQSKQCTASKGLSKQQAGLKIAYYEAVKLYSWWGLVLAVQQQPVVVNIEASSSAFINYKGGIFTNPSCYSDGVDHSVLVVGYDLTADVKHWIIRNSWGPKWGIEGYMRLAITGGAGICGINTTPGLYPVFKKPKDPCNIVNFADSVQDNPRGPGTVNPCGRFKCRPKGASYTCDCSSPSWVTYKFVAAANIDGSQTCVPEKPCIFFPTNPCGVGTCVDSTAGTYTCICPLGYLPSAVAYDNSPTCMPGAVASGPKFYTVPPGPGVVCSLIYEMYGVPKAMFLEQNPKVNCAKAIPPGVEVNVTSPTALGCSLPYALSKKDTCASVAKLFKIKALSGHGSPNPDLDCSKLQPGQQVCIRRGAAPDLPLCTQPYILKEGETCTSVIKTKLGGNAAQFFALNPGLYCDRLAAPVANGAAQPGQQVCLGATPLQAINRACPSRKRARVQSGESCQQIYKKYFNRRRRAFLKANKNVSCEDMKLVKGSFFCLA